MMDGIQRDPARRCTVKLAAVIIVFSLGLCAMRPVQAMERVVSYTVHASLVLLEGTLKIAAKTVWQNPKLIMLIIALYYYKEIWQAIKDGTGSLVGEYPLTSFAAGLVALWYISEVCGAKS